MWQDREGSIRAVSMYILYFACCQPTFDAKTSVRLNTRRDEVVATSRLYDADTCAYVTLYMRTCTIEPQERNKNKSRGSGYCRYSTILYAKVDHLLAQWWRAIKGREGLGPIPAASD